MGDRDRAAGEKPTGFTAFGLFLFFGASMASLAGVTLLYPDTVLDRVWALNPRAYAQLAPLGRPVGGLFALLSATLCCAGIGWFLRRTWGWRLAVAILFVQAMGDAFNLMRGDLVRGGIGFIIAVLVLLYLWHPGTRVAFRRN
jgi:hypothetical protein